MPKGLNSVELAAWHRWMATRPEAAAASRDSAGGDNAEPAEPIELAERRAGVRPSQAAEPMPVVQPRTVKPWEEWEEEDPS